jgi:hypothetical protein
MASLQGELRTAPKREIETDSIERVSLFTRSTELSYASHQLVPGRLDKSPQSPPLLAWATLFFSCVILCSAPKVDKGRDQVLSRIRGGLGLFAAISHACMHVHTSYTPEFHTLEYEKRGFGLMTPLFARGAARDKLCRRGSLNTKSGFSGVF